MPNDQTHEFKGVGVLPFAKRYDNFIGGTWVAPKSGKYFMNTTPITGGEIGEIARAFEYGSRCLAQTHLHFIGHDMSQGRLAKSGRTKY